MDRALSIRILDSHWERTLAQARSLGIETSRDEKDPLLVYVRYCFQSPGDRYLGLLSCEDYDEKPPRLDFANPENPADQGKQWWPKMSQAPVVLENGQTVLCTPGTRGYHEHSSHRGETHPKSVWYLPKVLSVLWKYFHWGDYQGRGIG